MKRMKVFQNEPWGKRKSLEEEVNDFLKVLDEAGIPDDDISIQTQIATSDKHDLQFLYVYVIWNHGLYAKDVSN